MTSGCVQTGCYLFFFLYRLDGWHTNCRSSEPRLIESTSEPVQSIVTEYAEIGFDTIIGIISDSKVLEEIPFISTAISIFKIGKTVAEYHHLKQLIRFIDEINKNIVDEKKYNKYIRSFKKKSQKERDKELEYIVLIIGQYISEDKPDMLAKLYLKYIEKELNWNQFVSYSEVINRLLPGDVAIIKNGNYYDIDIRTISDSLLRLESLGVYATLSKEVTDKNNDGHLEFPSANIKDYVLTAFGETLKKGLFE